MQISQKPVPLKQPAKQPPSTRSAQLAEKKPDPRLEKPDSRLEKQNSRLETQDPRLEMRQPKAEKEAEDPPETIRVPKQKLPEIDRKMNNITPAPKDQAMVIRRSYAMVISSYENVARHGDLKSGAADQLAETLDRRINELNTQARRAIEDLPEYKKLNLEEIHDLGSAVGDMVKDEDEYLKAFALLKNPQFASLMESSETVHRSFSEMMQDHGDEQLLFGAIEMVNDMGGLDSLKPQTPPHPMVDIKA